jgi:hypothetical protein
MAGSKGQSLMFGLGAIISALMPLVTAGVTAYNKSKDVAITAIQSAGSLAASQVQAMSLWIGHPLSPPSIMCYAIAIWFFKAVAMDKVIGPALGYSWSTDPLTGETAALAAVVVSGMFFSGIANIIKR